MVNNKVNIIIIINSNSDSSNNSRRSDDNKGTTATRYSLDSKTNDGLRGGFSIFTGTWNVGNAPPPAMSPRNGLGWLDKAFQSDIVVIGVQESDFSNVDLEEHAKQKQAEREERQLQESIENSHVLQRRNSLGISYDLESLLVVAVRMRSPASGVTIKDRTRKFSKHKKTFVGSDAVEWMIAQSLAPNNIEACHLGTKMMEAGLFSHIHKKVHVLLNDHTLYRFQADEGPYSALEFETMVRRYSRTRGNPSVPMQGDDWPYKGQTWPEILPEIMPTNYESVASHTLGEMHLSVFLRRSLLPALSGAATASKATGIGGVYTNKGGIVAMIKLGGLRLAFYSCHLAAHRGYEYLLARHHDVKEILRHARIESKEFDLYCHAHHVFLMGDLNYRIDLPVIDPSLNEDNFERQWAQAAQFIDHQQWQVLLQADQLQREKQQSRVLVNFAEGDINFAPTFKRVRGQEQGFLEQRIPSYCDRVLFTSLPHRARNIRLLSYDSAPQVTTSDHKPVYATFHVDKILKLPGSDLLQAARDNIDTKKHYVISFPEIVFQGAASNASKSHVFLRFFGPDLFPTNDEESLQSAAIRTTVGNVTTVHRWFQTDIPELPCTEVADDSELLSQSFAIGVFSHQRKHVRKRDKNLGSCVISLAPALRSAPEPWQFTLQLTRCGVPQGVLSGTVFLRCSETPFAPRVSMNLAHAFSDTDEEEPPHPSHADEDALRKVSGRGFRRSQNKASRRHRRRSAFNSPGIDTARTDSTSTSESVPTPVPPPRRRRRLRNRRSRKKASSRKKAEEEKQSKKNTPSTSTELEPTLVEMEGSHDEEDDTFYSCDEATESQEETGEDQEVNPCIELAAEEDSEDEDVFLQLVSVRSKTPFSPGTFATPEKSHTLPSMREDQTSPHSPKTPLTSFPRMTSEEGKSTLRKRRQEVLAAWQRLSLDDTSESFI
eukprot:m.177091 g.177091  ORF g.177091 m.177091 type:complete len:943 (+) comp25322_c2_seq3:1097-3925(+)